MNRPFRNANYGGAALLAQVINEGVNSFAKNFLDMRQQDTDQRLIDLSGRQQAMSEGIMAGDAAPIGGGNQPPVSSAPDFLNVATLQEASNRPVGADVLATNPQMPKRAADMTAQELRDAAFSHTMQARESALANETDIAMLQKAFHYNQLMRTSKPHLDTWTRVLDEARRQEEPDKAFSMPTQEYTKLRGQHEKYATNYAPHNEHLTSRGITPDLYDDESKFLQFRNQRKAQPHRLQMGASTLSPLSRRPGMRRSFGGR